MRWKGVIFMSRAKNLFGRRNEGIILPDTKNFDGYPAYNVSLSEQYVQMVMTNTVGNTYYMSDNELFEYSLALHEKMKDTNPKFMAKAITYARNRGFMRLQPIVGLAYLSLCNDKSYFHAAFDKVILTPNDLTDFVTVIGNLRNGKGFGRTVKRAINNWLTNHRDQGLSQYHAIKYGGGEGTGKWTLSDIIRETHPIPKNSFQSDLFRYLTRKEVSSVLDQARAIEDLKILAQHRKEYDDIEFTKRANELISRGRLPYEIVTGIIKPTHEIWESLMYQMPIFALVRHLNTLEAAGVFNNPSNVEHVVERLTNPDVIKNSKMLPFRFTTAYKNYNGNRNIKEALNRALDLSLSNVDMLLGRNAIFLDISSSMSGDYIEIGALLGISALKKSNDAIFLCFNTALVHPQIDMSDSVMTNVSRCVDLCGGGTNVGVSIEHLLGEVGRSGLSMFASKYRADFPRSERTSRPIRVDNIIIITDEQQNAGTPVVQLFRKYRRMVNPDARLFIIDVAPYRPRMASDNEPGVAYFYGWNEAVLEALKYEIEGTGAHVAQINRVRL